ncbi:MAG TPA: class I SAM-dependent methyltransferase [Bacteroidota bacterium]|nr:class I SAM-dependent methyltransferase [Bacteroidota bacterium]
MTSGLERVTSFLPSKIDNFLWEKRLGISTRGIVDPLPEVTVNYNYMTLSYRDNIRILKTVNLTLDDIFVDIGCGKGRMLCCSALSDVREAIGIEQSPELCAIARSNAARLRGRKAPITIIQGRAQELDYRKGTVFYLYNPFDPSVFGQVLDRIRLSLDEESRPIRIVYARPDHEECLEACPWLEKVDSWMAGRRATSVGVSFWRSRLPVPVHSG